MKRYSINNLFFYIMIFMIVFLFSINICIASTEIEIELKTTNGKTISGLLVDTVSIKTEFGIQKIPANKIKSIAGGEDIQNLSKIPWVNIYSLDALFAAKGNESDKDGYISVSGKGDVINSERAIKGKLPINNVSEIKIEFYGAHFSGVQGSGYLQLEIFDDNNTIIDRSRFDIEKTINDWKVYKLKSHLEEYKKVININNKNVSNVRLFVHPGNWAVVVRGLEIKAR